VVRKESAFDYENGLSVLKERFFFLLGGRDRFLVFVESKQSNKCIRREGMCCSYRIRIAMAGIDMSSEIRVLGLLAILRAGIYREHREQSRKTMVSIQRVIYILPPQIPVSKPRRFPEGDTLLLSQSSNKQALIIPTRLALDSMDETLVVVVLICAFDVVHVVLIPMNPDHPVREQRIVSAGASHCFLEEYGVAHGFVGACAELLKQRGFHVAMEFLKYLSA
jgi:hypothetical protein